MAKSIPKKIPFENDYIRKQHEKSEIWQEGFSKFFSECGAEQATIAK